MFKRILCTIISVAFIVSSFSVSAAIVENNAGKEYDRVELAYDPVVNYTPSSSVGFSDITDSELKKYTGLMVEIGVLSVPEDGLFKPETDMTRFEFIDAVLKGIDISAEEIHQPEMDGFYDTERESYENKVLSVAARLGIISGYNDNSFGGDNPITYTDAVTMLMRASGYSQYAAENGGYPLGYMEAARMARVDIKPKDYNKLTRAEAAKLLAVWLDSPVLKTLGMFGETLEVSALRNNTVIYVYHDLYKATGIVTSNITSGVAAAKYSNRLTIDNKAYEYSNSDFNSYLAYKVDYYYRIPIDSAPFIVYMSENRDVETVNIAADKYIDVVGGVINYYDGDKRKSLKLSNLCDVFVNGVLVTPKTYKEVLDNVKEGAFIALSNNEGTDYTTLFVNEYNNMVIESVTALDDVVSLIFKFNFKTVEIDMTKDIRLEFFDAAGSKIEYKRTDADTGETAYDFSKIPSGAVLSIYADKWTTQRNYKLPSVNSKYIKIVVGTNELTGTADIITTPDEYVIADKEVTLSGSNFINEDESRVELGSTGTFYMDFTGELVYFSEDSESIALEYGYLVSGGTESALSDKLILKILTTSNEIITTTAVDKVMLNGKRLKGGEAYSKLSASAKMANPSFTISQLIKYALNDDGRIDEIETILQPQGQAQTAAADHLRLDEPKAKYRNEDSTITWAITRERDDPYPMWTSTNFNTHSMPELFFTVPSIETFDDRDYSIGLGKSTFRNEVLEFYDVTKSRIPKVAVRYIDSSSLGQDKAVLTNRGRDMPVMIKEFSHKLRDDGIEVLVIKAVTGEAEVEYTSTNFDVQKGFKPGDLVKLYTDDTHNNVSRIENVVFPNTSIAITADNDLKFKYLLEDDTSELWSSANITSTDSKVDICAYGEVYSIDGSSFVIQRGALTGIDGERNFQVLGRFVKKEFMYGGAIIYDNTESERNPVIKPAKITDIKSVFRDGAENATRVFFSPVAGTARMYVFYNLKR